jgi:hypothetical protein
MNKMRDSVEWSFGQIIQLFPLADLKSTQKLDGCVDVLCAEICFDALAIKLQLLPRRQYCITPPTLEDYLGMV